MRKIIFAILIFITACSYGQVVDVGSSANDGTGDDLRTAMTKINNSFQSHSNTLLWLIDTTQALRTDINLRAKLVNPVFSGLIMLGTDTIPTFPQVRSLVAAGAGTGYFSYTSDDVINRNDSLLLDITNLTSSLGLALKANKANPVFSGTAKLSTDTLATRSYARMYGGTLTDYPKYNTGFGDDVFRDMLIANAGGTWVGDYNVGIGYLTFLNLVDGEKNTAIGSRALELLESGEGNTAVGFQSLGRNTASYNTAVGEDALFNNTTGSYNTATGYDALRSVYTSDYNVAYGYGAGTGGTHTEFNSNPSHSIYIGAYANPLAAYEKYQIVIGTRAKGYGSYTATLGSDSIRHTYLKGTLHVPNGATISGDSIKFTGLAGVTDRVVSVTPTGALRSDPIEGASEVLVMPLEWISKRLKDRQDGEIKMYYKKDGELTYSYGLQPNFAKALYQIQGATEINLRYIARLKLQLNVLYLIVVLLFVTIIIKRK